MFKKFGHYIILCLIKQITLEFYVCGQPLDSDKTKAISDGQWEFLAGSVCSDLEGYINVSVTSCQNNFRASQLPPDEPKRLPPVKIRCQSKYSIQFQIEPSHNWQLVVLLPELSNDTEADMFLINYGLIGPTKEYGEVSTTPIRNYSLWSTELTEGTPIEWHGSDIVPIYNEPPHKKYDVKVEFFRENVANETLVNGLLKWNTHGDGDACFVVENTCGKTGSQNTKIGPDSNPEKLFTNLIVDDKCDIQVIGLYGTTHFTYQTPPCDQYPDCKASIMPEKPQDLYIEASEETSDSWEVLVRWSSPTRAVEQYNLTLYSTDTWSLVVAGNETEAVFKGVTGKGVYTVSIVAILRPWAVHTSSRAVFPVRGPQPGAPGPARALALGAAATVAAALALLAFCRRRRHTPALSDYPTEDKPSKENDIETVSITLETEDSWEVRSDKLLLHEVIGEGAFGVVRRATLEPHGTNVAVKMLKDFPSLEEIRSFRSEMELMKSVGVHPHLVSLVGCCSGRRPLIVAEYCSRGDLLTYLRCTWDVMVSKRNAKYYNNNIDPSDYRNDLFKCKIQMENSKLVVNKLYELQEICDRELTSLDLLSFCRQIAMGMEFLAANRVVHRDLAARNILVTADRTLKIADFGLSRDVYEENQYKQKGNGKMPVKWMALESLTRRIYTTQSDVWSFGVVVWEVATVGAAPYASVPAARLPRLLRAGYRMPRPANCSPLLYDIMLSCWRSHPRERPTFVELHARLDELLNSASAHQYLSLEIEPVDAPPTPKHHRYIKMFMRGKRSWSRGETYERPLKPLQSNHYTSPPVVLTKTPPV